MYCTFYCAYIYYIYTFCAALFGLYSLLSIKFIWPFPLYLNWFPFPMCLVYSYVSKIWLHRLKKAIIIFHTSFLLFPPSGVAYVYVHWWPLSIYPIVHPICYVWHIPICFVPTMSFITMLFTLLRLPFLDYSYYLGNYWCCWIGIVCHLFFFENIFLHNWLSHLLKSHTDVFPLFEIFLGTWSLLCAPLHRLLVLMSIIEIHSFWYHLVVEWGVSSWFFNSRVVRLIWIFLDWSFDIFYKLW